MAISPSPFDPHIPSERRQAGRAVRGSRRGRRAGEEAGKESHPGRIGRGFLNWIWSKIPEINLHPFPPPPPKENIPE